MAIAFVSQTTSVGTVNQTSVTTSVDVTAGNNRILIVEIAHKKGDSATNVTSVVFNGSENFTNHIERSTGDPFTVSEIWYLVNPSVTTANVVVTWSVAPGYGQRYSVTYLTGAAQSSPINASNSATGTSTTPSVSVTTTTDNCLLIDSLIWADSVAIPITVGSGQTQRFNGDANSSITLAVSTEPKATAGAVTMDWSSGNSRTWSICSVAVKPSVVDFPITASSGSLLLTGINAILRVGSFTYLRYRK